MSQIERRLVLTKIIGNFVCDKERGIQKYVYIQNQLKEFPKF
jgi:hypothetical protein